MCACHAKITSVLHTETPAKCFAEACSTPCPSQNAESSHIRARSPQPSKLVLLGVLNVKLLLLEKLSVPTLNTVETSTVLALNVDML